jgi:hypothetical protein
MPFTVSWNRPVSIVRAAKPQPSFLNHIERGFWKDMVRGWEGGALSCFCYSAFGLLART